MHFRTVQHEVSSPKIPLTNSGRFVRASKYRHVYGQPAKKELCYDNLRVTNNAWDSNIIKSNGKYLSVNWNTSGAGAFAVIPLEEVGKAPDTVPLFRGHTAAVLDTDWNPFDETELASASDDGKICLWKVPEDYSFHHYCNVEGDVKDISPFKVLSGHKRKVGHIRFHPTVSNVIASSSLDYSVKIWDTISGEAKQTLQHKDLVTSFAFNYTGNLIATASRDKKLRVWDIRSGEIISEGPGHEGAKVPRVEWLGQTDRIVTTGFSKLSDRQVGIWDTGKIEDGPIGGFFRVDSSAGVLMPFYDASTKVLFLVGKGDGNIRYYEFENDELFPLSEYSSTEPQRGFAVAPKRYCNVHENEIVRGFKTVNDHCVEPISFIVPRRAEEFQEDIFPPAPSGKPALSADEWFSGKECYGPFLVDMLDLYEGKEPSVIESKGVEEEEPKEEPKEVKELEKPSTPNSKPLKSNGAQDMFANNDVSDMLNKAADSSDEDQPNDENWSKSDDEVDSHAPEVAVKESSEENGKDEPVAKGAIISKEINPPMKESEPKDEPKVSMKESAKMKEPKETEMPKETKDFNEPKEIEKPKEIKDMEKPQEKSNQKPSETKSFTLKSAVEKLSTLVGSLESTVSDLKKLNSEKDERLAQMESKLDHLLKK